MTLVKGDTSLFQKHEDLGDILDFLEIHLTAWKYNVLLTFVRGSRAIAIVVCFHSMFIQWFTFFFLQPFSFQFKRSASYLFVFMYLYLFLNIRR